MEKSPEEKLEPGQDLGLGPLTLSELLFPAQGSCGIAAGDAAGAKL